MSCDICSKTHYQCIAHFLGNNDRPCSFLRSHGVSPIVVMCPNCGHGCTYRSDQHIWHVIKITKFFKRRECGFSSSEYKGTFLENTKLEPFQIVLLLNH
jgi:hypothetical protein